MNATDLKKAKRDVRRNVLARRDALAGDERERRSRAVIERFLDLPEVRAAGTVMAFWSFGSEVRTEPLLEQLHARGQRVVLPRVAAGALEPRAYVPGDALVTTSFGALEPAGGGRVDPTGIDALAVPAVAFDRTGVRVGYGGGFYDRFLATTRADAARVGIGFDVQVVDGRLPAGPFDLRVDAIVTESMTIRCPGRGFDRDSDGSPGRRSDSGDDQGRRPPT
jgi:5-formyltetrahydrofolate cyclo-ligase